MPCVKLPEKSGEHVIEVGSNWRLRSLDDLAVAREGFKPPLPAPEITDNSPAHPLAPLALRPNECTESGHVVEVGV